MASSIVTKENVFVSRFTVDPKRKPEFSAIFDALREGTRPVLDVETNFVFYGWGRDDKEFVAIESWKSDAVVAQLRATPEFQKAVSALLACCAAPMTMELFSGVDGGRQVFDLHPPGPSLVHPVAGEINVEFL